MTWNVAEAKAKFSELVTKAGDAPQVIRNRGREVAVVLSLADYARLGAGRAAAGDHPQWVTTPTRSTSVRIEED